MIVLVDMDGVLSDFAGGFMQKWLETYPDKFYVCPETQSSFKLSDDYPKYLRPLIKHIITAPRFVECLPVVPGALEALYAMHQCGFDVRICTSPLGDYENCVLEKYHWVEIHLGREWTRRIILTKDKTLVRGDILIDDKPEITGAVEPVWEHIVYDQPYNRNVHNKRRLTWENWREVLEV